MLRISIFLWALVTVLIQGCGARQLYEGLQNSQRFECQKSSKYDIEACLESTDVNYEEYETERQDVLKHK